MSSTSTDKWRNQHHNIPYSSSIQQQRNKIIKCWLYGGKTCITLYYYCIQVYQNAPAMGFTGILLEPRLSNPVCQPLKASPGADCACTRQRARGIRCMVGIRGALRPRPGRSARLAADVPDPRDGWTAQKGVRKKHFFKVAVYQIPAIVYGYVTLLILYM